MTELAKVAVTDPVPPPVQCRVNGWLRLTVVMESQPITVKAGGIETDASNELTSGPPAPLNV